MLELARTLSEPDPRQQGLKPDSVASGDGRRAVLSEPDPRQQGLKHAARFHPPPRQYRPQRARSTTTRIETSSLLRGWWTRPAQRARSTTTRIETDGGHRAWPGERRLSEPDPRQQGLKHRQGIGCEPGELTQRARSTTTRIETSSRASRRRSLASSASQIHDNKD